MQKYKEFKTALLGKIAWLRNKENKVFTAVEVKILIEELLNNYEKFNLELKSRVELKSWKGKSGLTIFHMPRIFQVIEFRKDTPTSKPKELKHNISIIDVNRVLNTLQKLELNKRYKVREICRDIIDTDSLKEKEFTEFYDDLENFDYPKLFGTRKVYLNKFYYCFKIAEWLGYITYSKKGVIIRIKDKIEIQTEF